MDAFVIDHRDHSSDDPEMEQPDPAEGSHAFVYGASCPALQVLGRNVGFDMLLIGVAADPLASIRDLGRAEHGRGGMIMDDVQAAMEPWNDWVLHPVASGIGGSAAQVEPWGGVLRVNLVHGQTPSGFARRLATVLAPLEAARHAVAAGPASARCTRGIMPPPMPRFTRTDEGWIPAGGIYRWSGPEDCAFATRAIRLAMDPEASGVDVLDLLAEGDDRLRLPGGIDT